MKKYKQFIMFLLIFSISPVSSKAVNATEPVPVSSAVVNRAEQNKVYENRVLEIKGMDKSKLNSFQKKELRKELRTMKKAINNGGIYLSVGSIIIIVLLLILLL